MSTAGAWPSTSRTAGAAPAGGVTTAASTPAGVAAFQRPRLPEKSAGGRPSPPRRLLKQARNSERSTSIFDLPVDEKQVPRGWSPAVLDEAGPHGVAATYRFRAPEHGGLYDLSVRFSGRRKDVVGPATPADQFERVERLTALPAGGGAVSLTTRVANVNPGVWRVVATPESASPEHRFARRVIETQSRFSPLAQGPGVRLWAWPTLVGIGAVAALVLQAVLAHRGGINALPVVLLSFIGALLGFAGGKLWYLVLHRKPLTDFVQSGACIQGFLMVSLAVLAGGAALLELPARTVLDVSTPGIFLAVAIGRPGCFFTGCCVGRPTASRWGLVSSDRRLTLRRVPVQLLEAGSGLTIGVLSFLTVVLVPAPVPGAVFFAAGAAYTLARQLLFPLRVESRTPKGRFATAAGSALVAAVAVATFWL